VHDERYIGLSNVNSMGRSKKQQSSSESESESSSDESTSQSSSEESSETSESESSSEEQTKKKTSKAKGKTAAKGKGKKETKKSPKKGQKRKSKKKKDVNAPKKPTSGYFFFAAKRRADFINEKSTLKMLDKSKQIASDWKELSEKDREPYLAKAAQDKKRYEKEKANYTPPDNGSDSSSDDGPKKKKSKKTKDPNAPKKALSSYMFFYIRQKSWSEGKTTRYQTNRSFASSWCSMEGTFR